jgi:plastocyanin
VKKYLPFVVVVIVIVAIVGIAVANKDDKKIATPPAAPATNSSSSSNEQSSNSSNTANPSAQSSTSNTVSIANMSFSPASITVTKGTTVTWTNNDSVAHTVTATTDKEHGPNSDNIAPGKTYSFTFKDSGTFNYFCKIHPSMTGKVTVTE